MLIRTGMQGEVHGRKFGRAVAIDPAFLAPLLLFTLAVAIVARDIVIVVGAIAFILVRGHLDIAPTRLSKIHTFFEFAVLLLVMASTAGWIETGRWMPTVFLIVLLTVVASGAQYLWLWGRKAVTGRRTH